jgi:tetratricopeptide (TPR) repeat protein
MADLQGKRQRELVFLLGLVLIAGTLACYWPVRHDDYVNLDDWVYVYDNPIVERGLTWEGVKWAFTSVDGGNWHPLVWITHMLDCRMFGPAAGGHHVTNVVLHIANVLLLFGLLRAMTGTLWRSAFTAALFAWHPLHVESVAWVSERKDVLSTLFWLLTMRAYVAYAREFKVNSIWAGVYYKWAVAFFVLGLMSKAMLVTLPLVLLLMDWWPLKRISWLQFPVLASKTDEPSGTVIAARALIEKVPFFLLSAAGCVVAVLAQHDVHAMGRQGLFLRLENAAVSCITYLGEFFWPWKLAVFYPYPSHISLWRAAGAAVILVVISLGVFRLRNRKPYFAMGWLWFLVTLAPVIGLLQVGAQSHADRYTYVPYIGLGLMASWGLADLAAIGPRLRVAAMSTAAAALAGFVAVTITQVKYWKNSATLYEHALQVTSGNYLAHNNLGKMLGQSGQENDAMTHFRIAVTIKPDYPDGWYNLGAGFERQGNLTAAITNYAKAINIQPHYLDARINLGNCYLRLGQTNDAVSQYQATLQLHPYNPAARERLGNVYLKQGKMDEAEEQYEEALRLNPISAKLYSALGQLRSMQGRAYEAAKMYSNALWLEPKMAEAHWNLGSLRLQEGKTEEGLGEMKKGVDLSPGYMELRLRLGDALVKAGRPAEALPYYVEVAQAEPKDARARFAMAQAHLAEKHFEEAAANLKQAVALAPDSPEYLDGLARIYAICPKAELRNGTEAVRLAERACELSKRQNSEMLDTLAAAYAEVGRFADAVKVADEARALAEASGDSKTAAMERQRIDLYRAGKPYHEEP